MNRMQLLKRRFFAMRNGITADVLRRSGAPFRMIFGLNLPQIIEIAREFGPDPEMARALRADVNTRESVLAAPMFMPSSELGIDEAAAWGEELPRWPEAADILCHRLLRYTPFASELCDRWGASEDSFMRYTALRLALNLGDAALIRRLAEADPTSPLSRRALADLNA